MDQVRTSYKVCELPVGSPVGSRMDVGIHPYAATMTPVDRDGRTHPCRCSRGQCKQMVKRTWDTGVSNRRAQPQQCVTPCSSDSSSWLAVTAVVHEEVSHIRQST